MASFAKVTAALFNLALPAEWRDASRKGVEARNDTPLSVQTPSKTEPISNTDHEEIAPILNPPAGPSHGPLKIIYGGMMRMGSLSMAHAFATLGFRTHHLLEERWDVWSDLLRAAEATFTIGNETKPPRAPFTRKDWDRMLGSFDAVTDMAGYFLPQLVDAYPDAKVVLVQRDFDRWWASISTEVVEPKFPKSKVTRWAIIFVFDGIVGVGAAGAMNRILKGWFRADDLEGVRRNARARYEEHYAWVRANVPKERLLEYRLGDGWEPLCEFLEVDVPEKSVRFPRVNDKVEHRKRTDARMLWLLPKLKRRLLIGVVVPVGILAVLLPVSRAVGWV